MTRNEELAVKALPVLVRYAHDRKTLTYKELSSQIGGAPIGMGTVLGIVRDKAEEAAVPRLSCIVVAQDGKPGDDWLPADEKPFMYSLSIAEQEEYWQRQKQRVFNHRGWETFLIRNGIPADEALAAVSEQPTSGGMAGGESAAHRALKESIRNDPGIIGLQPARPAAAEYVLRSGDEIDVFVETAGTPRLHAVEVKIDDPEEIRRGVFQAIKYRAVLAAERGLELSSADVCTHLVTRGPLPADAIARAEKYGVNVHVLPLLPKAESQS